MYNQRDQKLLDNIEEGRQRGRLNKAELEGLLEELDKALVKAFPDSPPIKALVVGGACLMFAGIVDRPTRDIDIIIWDLMGSEEEFSLIFDAPLANKIRKTIARVGGHAGLKGNDKLFLNDDCSPFLLELSRNELPEMQLFRAYQRIHLYLPQNLAYILACKFLAGREDKDFSDIRALCELLHIQTRVQAQQIVDSFFPSKVDQNTHLLPQTLKTLFSQ